MKIYPPTKEGTQEMLDDSTDNRVDQEYQQEKDKKAVDIFTGLNEAERELLNYAFKEGYIDQEQVESMTTEELKARIWKDYDPY